MNTALPERTAGAFRTPELAAVIGVTKPMTAEGTAAFFGAAVSSLVSAL